MTLSSVVKSFDATSCMHVDANFVNSEVCWCSLVDTDGDGMVDTGEFMDAVDHYSRLACGKEARKVCLYYTTI